MSLGTWFHDLRFDTATGNEAPPAAESRCYAFVTLVGGVQGLEPRDRHYFAGDVVCRRCGAPSPYLKRGQIIAPEQPLPEYEPRITADELDRRASARPERVMTALEGLSTEEFDVLFEAARAGGGA